MNDNTVYIPTYVAETNHTQFHKWDFDIVKFTILLKQDEFNGQVIDFSYAVEDLKSAGANYIDECLVWHFRRNKILPLPFPFRSMENSLSLINSDLASDDYLAIRDLYYPKNMKLPWLCEMIEENRREKHE